MDERGSRLGRRHFALARGGLLDRILHRVRLRSPGTIATAFVCLTWVPLMTLAAAEWLSSDSIPVLLTDVSLHARFLVAVPAFFFAETAVDLRTSRCIDRLHSGGVLVGGDEIVIRLTAGAARLRDALIPEVLLVALAALGAHAVLQGLTAPVGVIGGRPVDPAWTPLKSWYAFLSLPIYQFLLYRWLWRWAIWTGLLWRLSRLRWRPIATHVDRAGGLRFLSEPSEGLSVVVFGLGAVHAGATANQVLHAGASLSAVTLQLGVFMGLSLAIVFGPLLSFSGVLWRARFEAVDAYERLTFDYDRLFHERWIVRGEREGLLGAPEIQSLPDLASACQAVRQMRTIPFGLGALRLIVAAGLIPMIPVVLLEIPLREVVNKVAGIALGGAPLR